MVNFCLFNAAWLAFLCIATFFIVWWFTFCLKRLQSKFLSNFAINFKMFELSLNNSRLLVIFVNLILHVSNNLTIKEVIRPIKDTDKNWWHEFSSNYVYFFKIIANFSTFQKQCGCINVRTNECQTSTKMTTTHHPTPLQTSISPNLKWTLTQIHGKKCADFLFNYLQPLHS